MMLALPSHNYSIIGSLSILVLFSKTESLYMHIMCVWLVVKQLSCIVGLCPAQ